MANDEPTDPNYADWSVEGRSETTYVGQMEGVHHGIFDEKTGDLLRAEPKAGTFEPVETLDSSTEETLGERIERLGEQIGWESLSEFAREHLERDEE